jgi:hypothetical protein
MSALPQTTPQAQIKQHPAVIEREAELEAFLELVFDLALISVTSECQTTPYAKL